MSLRLKGRGWQYTHPHEFIVSSRDPTHGVAVRPMEKWTPNVRRSPRDDPDRRAERRASFRTVLFAHDPTKGLHRKIPRASRVNARHTRRLCLGLATPGYGR